MKVDTNFVYIDDRYIQACIHTCLYLANIEYLDTGFRYILEYNHHTV